MTTFGGVTPLREQLLKEKQLRKQEFRWLLDNEIQRDFQCLGEILKNTEGKLGIVNNIIGGIETEPEIFMMNVSNKELVKAAVTINGDCIMGADIIVLRPSKVNPQVPITIRDCWPLRLIQLRDAARFMKVTCRTLRPTSYKRFKSGNDVCMLVDSLLTKLNEVEYSLILPNCKHPAELINSENKNIFDPPLPDDILIDFYIERDKLIVVLFFISPKSPNQLHHAQFRPGNASFVGTNFVAVSSAGTQIKYEVTNTLQANICIPRLSDVLRSIALSKQLCQQIKDKVQAFCE